MHLLRAIVMMLALLPALAMAQTADQPVMGSTGSAGEGLPLEEQDQLVHILSIGDGVGGGLGAGLLRMGEIDGRYDVAIRFNEESGLARPEVYDWAATLPKILEANSYDVIVVLIGANDRQMIRDGEARYAFGSPEWIAAYKSQVDRLLDALKASGARVYWVSIPPMEDPDYDQAMRLVSDVQKQRVEARGAAYVDIRKSFLSPDGRYIDSDRDDNGAFRRLRGRDGISFFKQGNNLMGGLVLRAIQSPAPATMKTATTAPDKRVPLTAPERPAPAAREVPVFGRADVDGATVLLRPENVSVGAALTLAAGKSGLQPAEAMAMLQAIAPPGSSAERLFRSGAAGDVPAGRADDFRLPPKPAQ